MIHFLEKLRSSFVCCSIKRVYYTQFLNRQSNKEGYTIDAITLKCVKLRQLCVPKTFRTNKLWKRDIRVTGSRGTAELAFGKLHSWKNPLRLGNFYPKSDALRKCARMSLAVMNYFSLKRCS